MNSIYEKIRFLVNYLNDCTKEYDKGTPIISDKEWDEKYFELQSLEEQSGLILSNSPTQSISYKVVSQLNKKEHNHKMLSLNKTKDISVVNGFINKKEFLAMCKMDGLTCSLTYENGELVAAETRGNGLIGEDILHNTRTLVSVPKKIPHLEKIIIDGEIICKFNDFEEFSQDYKNPRNFAAGSIRLLDSKECSKRKLTFVVWDVISSLYNNDNNEMTVSQKLEYISPFGFTIVSFIGPLSDIKTNDDYEIIINDIKALAESNHFPIDGAVFKFNDCAYGRSMGETNHHFKNALAFKFYDEVYQTELIDIEWTMGRTGQLTPVAIFKPIDIDGSVVERASLHNISIMTELLGERPHPFQKIEVFKANQIIPQIYDADKSIPGTLYYMEHKDFEIPSICPVCGGPAEIVCELNTKVLQCSNPACTGKIINRIDHFCSKKALDIKGISKATFEKLIDWGWIGNISDIFTLNKFKNEWIKKPGFGEKSVEKMLTSIQTSSTCDLHQFITGLGIPLIGATAAKELEKTFQTWDAFINAAENKYAFYQIPNFGVEMHHSIVNFDYSEAKFMVDNYIHFNDYKEIPNVTNNNLVDKTFVITGKLKSFKNRDELKSLIESLGGKVVGSVSRNTSYLINNDVNSTSSKNKTAKDLNIPIMSEDDFISTFGIII